MKTAGRENPNHGATLAPQPSTWRGRSEQLSLDQVGWKQEKFRPTGEVFFLDFSLYRTYQVVGSTHRSFGMYERFSNAVRFGFDSVQTRELSVFPVC